MNKSTSYISSFKPVVGSSPRVLILGTMPGKESLRRSEYYGHPRNLFWKILFSLYHEEFQFDYKLKTDFLERNHLALWDVCHTAIRKTSLDSDIKEESPNDLTAFIESYPSLKIIAFNGQKAEKLYINYFEQFLGIRYVTLLSTSPANASFSYNEKLENWKQILLV